MAVKFLQTNSHRKRRFQLTEKSIKFHNPRNKLSLKTQVPIIYWEKIQIQLAASATISAVTSGSRPKRKETRPKNTPNNLLSSIKWSNSAKMHAGLKPRNKSLQSIKSVSLQNSAMRLTQTLASRAISLSLLGHFRTTWEIEWRALRISKTSMLWPVCRSLNKGKNGNKT